VLQQAQVTRYRRPTDGHRIGDLLDRLAATTEYSQYLPPVGVAQCLERQCLDLLFTNLWGLQSRRAGSGFLGRVAAGCRRHEVSGPIRLAA
jgi:hypothetical protein